MTGLPTPNINARVPHPRDASVFVARVGRQKSPPRPSHPKLQCPGVPTSAEMTGCPTLATSLFLSLGWAAKNLPPASPPQTSMTRVPKPPQRYPGAQTSADDVRVPHPRDASVFVARVGRQKSPPTPSHPNLQCPILNAFSAFRVGDHQSLPRQSDPRASASRGGSPAFRSLEIF